MKKQKLPIVLLLLVGILSSLAIVTYIGKNFLVHPENTPPRPPSSTISSEIDENDTTWKTYTNEKIGVSFEYPSAYVIETDREGDFRNMEDYYPYPGYYFSVYFIHKDSINEKPYPVTDFSFSMSSKGPKGHWIEWYPDLKPTSKKVVNNYTWEIYLPMTCEKDAPDKTKCNEQSGYTVLTYFIEIGDYEYSLGLNTLNDNSLEFQRILSSIKITSPKLD